MQPQSYLTKAAILLSGATSVFVAGFLTERYRPFGSEWQRVQAVQLARRMGEMQRTTCCGEGY